MTHFGYVNKTFPQRGFSFIVDIADGVEYFAHRSQILTPDKTLEPGQKVSFLLGPYVGKTVALQIKLVAITENGGQS